MILVSYSRWHAGDRLMIRLPALAWLAVPDSVPSWRHVSRVARVRPIDTSSAVPVTLPGSATVMYIYCAVPRGLAPDHFRCPSWPLDNRITYSNFRQALQSIYFPVLLSEISV